MSYELLDHTGDIAIRIEEATREDLFTTGAQALFEIMIQTSQIAGSSSDIHAEGSDDADLLRNFLADLLYNFSVEGTIFVVDRVELTEGPRLLARGKTCRFDPERDELQTELKAVTYHQLEVQQHEKFWHAQVVFDV